MSHILNNRAILFTAVAMLTLTVPTGYAQDNCIGCHRDFEEDDGPAHLTTRDIHHLKGLGCSDCHGGDPTLEDMDEVRQSPGFIGVPSYREVPQFCARCHSNSEYMRDHNPSLPTDQLDKYRTSIHGLQLFGKRDEKVANCVSCHTAHEIGDGTMPNSSTYPTNVPYTCGECHGDTTHMAGYGIPTDQLSDYLQSVHGHALLERNDRGAPACNDCHSNHGAAPPGIASLDAVCGNCHAFQAELFLGSPHKNAFAENGLPMCATCHSNHLILEPDDSLVGTEEPAFCVECHSSDDGTVAFAVADSISAALTALNGARAEAAEMLEEAQLKGMHTTDEEFLLKEIDQIAIKSRSMVHAFAAADLVVEAHVGIGKADSVRVSSAALVDDYYFRRQGLVVASLIITLLAVLLYRRIKRIEQK
jgi:predicted CXXCH cytochrome family protein